MTMIGFKNTHNQDVYINPDQVLYITTFEEGVTIITFAVAGPGGKPAAIYVRGSVDLVRARLEGKGKPSAAAAAIAVSKAEA